MDNQNQIPKRIILPSRKSILEDDLNSNANSKTQRPKHPIQSPFSLPKTQIPFGNAGFERGSYYRADKTFSTGGQSFQEGEILEVIGSRKFGPMAALEIVFRNPKTGAKKFWVLHHDRHNYWQDNFTRIS
jgi:hypothetical protein